MFGFSLGPLVVVSVALFISAVWWEPPSAAGRRVFVLLLCCVGALFAGWFFGLAALALLDSFAVVPSTVQALATASITAALSRIGHKAGGRAGLAAVLSIAVLAGLLPVWVFGL